MAWMKTDETTSRTDDGLNLFQRSWRSEANSIVAIVHGYSEHSGRYDHVARHLAEAGHAVHAFDLRGHGRSEGRRVYVRAIDEYVSDLRAFLSRVRDHKPGLPLFLLGHSMGGTIVTRLLTQRYEGLSGAILSGAALRTGRGRWRIMEELISLIAKLAPRLPLGRLGSEKISRDPAVVADYDNDPLVYRGWMPAATAAALARATREIDANMEAITLPLLILHGASDELTDPDGSRRLYERAASSDKTLTLFDGLRHEILNEPEKLQVLAAITEWLDRHLE